MDCVRSKVVVVVVANKLFFEILSNIVKIRSFICNSILILFCPCIDAQQHDYDKVIHIEHAVLLLCCK